MIGLGFSDNSRSSHCAFPQPASSAPAALPAMADATIAALVCKNVRRLNQDIVCSFRVRGRNSGDLDLVLSCRQGGIRPVATRRRWLIPLTQVTPYPPPPRPGGLAVATDAQLHG